MNRFVHEGFIQSKSFLIPFRMVREIRRNPLLFLDAWLAALSGLGSLRQLE